MTPGWIERESKRLDKNFEEQQQKNKKSLEQLFKTEDCM